MRCKGDRPLLLRRMEASSLQASTKTMGALVDAMSLSTKLTHAATESGSTFTVDLNLKEGRA